MKLISIGSQESIHFWVIDIDRKSLKYLKMYLIFLLLSREKHFESKDD
jgi:hypothetical protein